MIDGCVPNPFPVKEPWFECVFAQLPMLPITATSCLTTYFSGHPSAPNFPPFPFFPFSPTPTPLSQILSFHPMHPPKSASQISSSYIQVSCHPFQSPVHYLPDISCGTGVSIVGSKHRPLTLPREGKYS